MENNTFSAPQWPKCSYVTQCPDPTSFMTPEQVETTWNTGDSLNYATTVKYSCQYCYHFRFDILFILVGSAKTEDIK